MKVAIVVGTLERGGSERQIVELVRASHPRHIECVVICQGDEGPLASEVRAVGAKVMSLGLNASRDPRGVVCFARGLMRFARLLRQERPDVIYAFLFWGYCISLPLATIFLPRACRIQGRRSLPDADVPGRPLLERLRLVADSCTHGAIANSLAVGRTVAGHEPSLAGRLWVVPNGVLPAPPALREDRQEVTILCVANLSAYKGHATLIQALSRMPDGEWTTLLAGDGPERAAIAAMIEAHGLERRVQLLGRRADVGDLLARADIFVLPSYTEGLPNAVLEAMVRGIPVVASDVGGVRGVLGSGAGIVVPPRDKVALAQALQSLIDDRCLRYRMGDLGRELALGALSVESMRDATLRCFEEIARERHNGAGRVLS